MQSLGNDTSKSRKSKVSINGNLKNGDTNESHETASKRSSPKVASLIHLSFYLLISLSTFVNLISLMNKSDLIDLLSAQSFLMLRFFYFVFFFMYRKRLIMTTINY